MVDPDAASKPSSPAPDAADTRPRRASVASRISLKARGMSKDFEESSPPAGFMAATSQFASSAIVGDVPRRNSVNSANSAGQQTPQRRTNLSPPKTEVPRESAEFNDSSGSTGQDAAAKGNINTAVTSASVGPDRTMPRDTSETAAARKSPDTAAGTAPYDNGYHFPPTYPKSEALKHGLMSFLHYSMTPTGFFVVVYGLNVVAWGGMLFLLLCNATPAMCYPSCNDINSPRRVWIEYDSQVLTALFSLSAFGLAPWRFRDLYYLLKYRLCRQQDGLRRLAGIHRDWFRLPESETLPVNIGPDNVEDAVARGDVRLEDIPEPARSIADAPLTGVRASATKVWKMDLMIWNMVWNTLLQCVLSGFMWGMNRFNRPSWATGLFVALGCIVAAIGGLIMFFEGRRVKAIEGVPLTDRDRARLAQDQAEGRPHYNNLKDKPPKEKAKTKTAGRDEEKGDW